MDIAFHIIGGQNVAKDVQVAVICENIVTDPPFRCRDCGAVNIACHVQGVDGVQLHPLLALPFKIPFAIRSGVGELSSAFAGMNAVFGPSSVSKTGGSCRRVRRGISGLLAWR